MVRRAHHRTITITIDLWYAVLIIEQYYNDRPIVRRAHHRTITITIDLSYAVLIIEQ